MKNIFKKLRTIIILVCMTFVSIIGTSTQVFATQEDQTTESEDFDTATTKGSVDLEEPTKSTISLAWVSTGGSSNNTSLDLTPTQNYSESVTYKLTYTMNEIVAAEKGEIEIRIPISIFSKRDGSVGDKVYFGLAEAPSTSDSTGYHYYRDGDDIVITNFNTITSGSSLEFTVDHTVTRPSTIKDGYTKDFNAEVLMNIGGEEKTISSNSIDVTMHTDAKLERLLKFVDSKYEKWQPVWGEKPIDAEDYFYVSWEISCDTKSNATQPYTISFTENVGVHGTLVGVTNTKSGLLLPTKEPVTENTPDYANVGHDYYAIVKYPKSILDVDTEVENIITADLVGIDGATDSMTTRATFNTSTLNFKYSGDLFRITKQSGSRDINGGINALEANKNLFVASAYSSFILEADSKGWSLTNDGKDSYTTDLIDDVLFLEGEQLNDADYNIKGLYLSSYDVYDGLAADIISKDYVSYEPIVVYYKTASNGSWNELGKVQKTADKTYVFTDTATSVSDEISVHNQVKLPENAVAIKLSHTSNKVRCVIKAGIGVDIHPTDHVKGLIKNKNLGTLQNIDTLVVTDKDGDIRNPAGTSTLTGSLANKIIELDKEKYGVISQHDTDYYTLKKLSSTTRFNKYSTTRSEIANRQEVIKYQISMYEVGVFPEGFTNEEAIQLGFVPEQTQSVFYDLLPAGAIVKPQSIQTRVYNYSSFSKGKICPYTVETVDNWQNSGQTMLIVTVSKPLNYSNYDFNESVSDTSLFSGFYLEYEVNYSWESIGLYGTNLTNSVAYRSSTGELSGGKTAMSSSLPNKQYFQDLDNDGVNDDNQKNTVYDYRNDTLSVVTTAVSGLSKKVKATDGVSYNKAAEVSASNMYTYQLLYGTGTGAKATDFVFYDVLEEYANDPTQWKGTFESIDTSYLEQRGIQPVIYYSTSTSLTNSSVANTNLQDTSLWSTTMPTDKTKITAIAVDCSKKADGTDYVIESSQSIACNIMMRAPSNYKEYLNPTVYAYNNVQASLKLELPTTQPEKLTLITDATKVSLREPDVSIDKTSSPTSGTKEKPTVVSKDDKIAYTVAIKNTNTLETMYGVEIEDAIQADLIMDIDTLEVYFNDDPATLVSASSRVTVTQVGNTLTYTVDKLEAGESVHLMIPTKVSTGTADQTVIKNTAVITKYNDLVHEIKSKTTYHITDATYTFKATKVLVGKALAANDFSFVVKDADGKVVATGKNEADGSITFTDLTFKKAGEYTYKISEVQGADEKITYDDTVYTVKLTVTEKDGKLTIASDTTKAMTFTNQYDDLTIDKTSSPASGTKEKPTFVAVDEVINYTIDITNTSTSDTMNGVEVSDVIQSDLTIDKDNLEVYFNSDPATLVSASSRVTVTQVGNTLTYTVDKLDAGESVHLVIPTKVSTGTADQTVIKNTAVITKYNNVTHEIKSKTTYHITEATYTFKATKALVGKTLAVNDFSFVVKDTDGKVVATGKNKADGSITFTDLTFKKAGEYTYTISEVQGTDEKITYDDTVYTVKLTVTEKDGKLTIVSDTTKAMTFTNQYEYATIDKTSSPASGTKEKPTFVAVDEVINYTIDITNTSTSDTMSGVEVSDVIQNDLTIDVDHLEVYFNTDSPILVSASSRVTVTQVGNTLTYTVDKLDAGETVHLVIPTKVSKGTANQTVIKNTAVITKYNNVAHEIKSKTTYHITEATYTFTATKALVGKALATNDFSFVVKDADDKVVATGKNKADGSITFTDLTFKKAGEYTYTISEVQGTDEKITYDDTVYTVKLTVTEKDGKLTIVSDATGALTFTNQYEYATIDKTSSPTSGTKEKPTFVAVDEVINYTIDITNTSTSDTMNGVEVSDVIQSDLTIDVDHLEVYFNTDSPILVSASSRVTVTQVGNTLTYTVDKLDAGESVHLVIPTKVSTGTADQTVIKNTAVITKYNNVTHEIKSKTTYHITEATYTFKATKALVGKTLAANDFSFVVKDTDDKVVATGKNKADGSITFTDLTFKKAGEYTYTISEVQGTDEKITYDDTVYTVKLTVTEKDGKLTIVSDTTGALTFTNIYENPIDPVDPSNPGPEIPGTVKPGPETPSTMNPGTVKNKNTDTRNLPGTGDATAGSMYFLGVMLSGFMYLKMTKKRNEYSK